MRHSHFRLAVILAGIIATSACTKPDWRHTALSVESAPSPAGANSTSPQMTTSSAGLILSWLEVAGGTATLKFAERNDAGWSAPMTAVSGPLIVNYADVPSVLRMSNGTLVAHWTKETDRTREGSDLFLSTSKDNGRTWSAPVSPHHDGTLTEHAFATLFELPAEGLGVIWLDARAYDLDDKDAIGLRYAAFDSAWTQTADAPIDAQVCECCPTSAAVTSDGVLTAYRDRSDEEIRDIYTSRLDGGTWGPGQPVHKDGWTIDACPVNGPAISAHGKDAVVAWFTAKNNAGQAYAAFSSDAGRTWADPIRLDDAASLGRVGVELLADGSAIASWVELAGKKGELRVRRIDRTGARSPATLVTNVSTSLTSAFRG